MNGTNKIIADKIRGCGIKPTSQRIAILKNILYREDHPGAEAVFEDLRLEFPTLSMNTIYMNLECFAKHGLVSRANFLYRLARYDGNTRPHPHFVCVRCRKILDLHQVRIPDLPVPEGGGVSEFFLQRTQLNGICTECG